MNIPFSVLDLAPITEGSNAAEALANSLDLAQHSERWGYKRYWLAEHHNMPGIASAATAVVIGHIAAGTKTIRVGAGGIMLPNHSPLVIAEQFGTLATLFPERIDLGLGRAPGTDMRTARALRRDLASNAEHFPQDLEELQTYFSDEPGQVQAVPGRGTKVPIVLLGSSLFSAQLAALKGLPYAFASHFAPTLLDQALDIYRSKFRPSGVLSKPHAIVAANLYAADSDEEAELLFSSVLQLFVSLRFGTPGPLPPPDAMLSQRINPMYLQAALEALRFSAIGGKETVRRRLESMVDSTGADELILVSHIFDHQKRLRSYEIGAEILSKMAVKEKR